MIGNFPEELDDEIVRGGNSACHGSRNSSHPSKTKQHARASDDNEDLKLLDVTQSSLFQDIYGFSEAESVASSFPQITDAKDYFLRGSLFYQRGEYLKAIEAYSKSIESDPRI